VLFIVRCCTGKSSVDRKLASKAAKFIRWVVMEVYKAAQRFGAELRRSIKRIDTHAETSCQNAPDLVDAQRRRLQHHVGPPEAEKYGFPIGKIITALYSSPSVSRRRVAATDTNSNSGFGKCCEGLPKGHSEDSDRDFPTGQFHRRV
jgi:hypothetical protein